MRRKASHKKNQNEKNYVNFILHAGSPQYLSRVKRKRADAAMRRWGGVSTAAGVLVCVVLAVGVFLVLANYLIPHTSGQGLSPVAAVSEPGERAASEAQGEGSSGPESAESAESPEPAVPVKYDAATGLPVYEDADILFVINAKKPADDRHIPVLTEFENILVDEKITDALRAMAQRAQQDGVPLKFSAGYVSRDEQLRLYEAKAQELLTKEKYTKIMARAKAEAYVPRPGEADTQSGLCVTLEGDRETFSQSAVYTWLNKFAADYGFAFRYPDDKKSATGLEGDLRVLRYVGAGNATAMRQLSMCLEEYVDYLGL